MVDPDDQPLTLVFLERGRIKILLNEDWNTYYAMGSPSNDAMNKTNERLYDIQINYNNKSQAGASEEELREIVDEYNGYIKKTINKNRNNIEKYLKIFRKREKYIEKVYHCPFYDTVCVI
jgi:hypothetical protein